MTRGSPRHAAPPGTMVMSAQGTGPAPTCHPPARPYAPMTTHTSRMVQCYFPGEDDALWLSSSRDSPQGGRTLRARYIQRWL
jgi:hypothetical protein